MVWNKAELLQRIMNNEDIIPPLLNAFIGDAPNNLAALKEALNQGDMDLSSRHAHTIKGMAANLAAQPLADVARDIEHAAKNDETDNLPALLAELEKQFDLVMECFEQELAS